MHIHRAKHTEPTRSAQLQPRAYRLILEDELHRQLDHAVVTRQQSVVTADVTGDLAEVRRVPGLLAAKQGSVNGGDTRREGVG